MYIKKIVRSFENDITTNTTCHFNHYKKIVSILENVSHEFWYKITTIFLSFGRSIKLLLLLLK